MSTPEPAFGRSLTAVERPRFKLLQAHREDMLDLAEAYEVANIRVFGSVARGTDGPQSDIDLLVDYDIDRGIQPLLHFMSDLELLLHEQVDVCPVDMLKDEILADALSYAVCF